MPWFGERPVNRTGFGAWVQGVAAIAVVVGLILVIWELQQARQLARAQVSSDSFALASQINAVVLGETAAKVVAKACDTPESLTGADFEILRAYYQSWVSVVWRVQVIEQRSGLYDGDWKQRGPGIFANIFSTAAGRGWWKSTRFSNSGELRELGDSLLAEAGPIACKEDFNSFQTETTKALQKTW